MSDLGFIYLLKNKSDDYYFRSTNNMERRLIQHNQGKSISTCSKKPWTIILKKEYADIKLARRLEQKMKLWKMKITEENFLKILTKCEKNMGL